MKLTNISFFGCELNQGLEVAGIFTELQGNVSIFFAISLTPFMGYFIYHLSLSISRSKNMYSISIMILSLLIISSLICRIYGYFNFVMFCSSFEFEVIMNFIPVLFTAIIIYCFDFFIIKITHNILTSNNENTNEIEKLKNEFFVIKLPALIFFSFSYFLLYIIFGRLFFKGFINDLYYSLEIAYVCFYSYLLIYDINYLQKIVIQISDEENKVLKKEIKVLKIIICLHFIGTLLWCLFFVVIPDLFGISSYIMQLTSYCISEGCVWHLLITYFYRIITEILIYMIFGIFTKQFIDLEIEYEKELANEFRSSPRYFIKRKTVNELAVVSEI